LKQNQMPLQRRQMSFDSAAACFVPPSLSIIKRIHLNPPLFMRFSFYHSLTALSTEPTLSGSASVPHSLAGQRAKAANPYESSPHLLLPALRWLLTASFSLLICFSTLAQNYNYNAGIGSGTGGDYSVMVGPYAGRINSGFHNSFVGSLVGYNNTTGANNSFLGYLSGYLNSEGNSNSFIGVAAGYNNTTGDNNSFLGQQAGYFNSDGNSNSFVGYQSGYKNNTGSYNSFLGYQSGYNTTGSYNSFLGMQAGYSNTTGSQNSFLGYAAGSSNTKGGYNSFLGSFAGYNTTGSYNSFLGTEAGYYNTTGSNNSFLGYYANPSIDNLTNASAIGSNAYVSASNSLVLGSISGVNDATASTKVGIGTSAPAYLLHVNGNAAKPGGGSWTVASDRRLKKNIATFSEGLDVLQKVKPVWFEYNGEAAMPTDQKYVGVIAQEMQKIAPYMVGSFTYQDTTGKKAEYLDYDANALTYILVNAVKEQQGQMEQLKKEKDAQMEQLNTRLQDNTIQIGSLQAQIEQLKQLLSSQLPAPSAEIDAAARLWQNEPNPTDGTTLIRYRIPRQASQAQIKLYSLKGEELKSFLIAQRGEGQLSLDTTTLPEGIYLYRLIVDGKPIDAKKLLLNR
jgi:hypothetical protein